LEKNRAPCRAHGASERRQACGAQAQAGADFAGRRRWGQRRGDRGQRWRGESTVYRTKRRFVLGNLEAALSEEPRPGASRKDEALSFPFPFPSSSIAIPTLPREVHRTNNNEEAQNGSQKVGPS
jgi:hypothetical protein